MESRNMFECPVIDPFSQLYVETDSLDIPMPREALRDDESLSLWPSSDMVGHLFTKDPSREERDKIAGDLSLWLENLDRWGIVRAGVPLRSDTPDEYLDRFSEHSDRIFAHLRVNPHDGMRAVRRIDDLVRRYPFIRSVSITPFQIYPFIAPNSKEYFPIYAKCVELGRPVFLNVGFPGPRVPAWTQDPMYLDEVCWFFPELTVVMRHGGEPWVDTCIKMLQRWPNLYYATTAFTPRRYPKQIVDYANTKRGADKVIFAGYWPMLSYERIFDELSKLSLTELMIPKFLGGNAVRVFGLDDS